MPYYVEALTTAQEGERKVRHIGEYDTLAEAIAASQSLIDNFLIGKATNQITIVELFPYIRILEKCLLSSPMLNER